MTRLGATLLRQLGLSPPSGANTARPRSPAPAPVSTVLTGRPPSVPPEVAGGMGLEQAREEVQELLERLDQVRPNTVRRRVLQLGSARLSHAAALGEVFELYDSADPSVLERLPFDDECFEFVCCCSEQWEQLRAADAKHWLAEILRVLRLRGVAAIEARSGAQSADELALRVLAPARPLMDSHDLAARVAAPPSPAGAAEDGLLVPVSITNVGNSTWPGSSPHQLQLVVEGSARRTYLELPGSLVPGDSFEVTVGLPNPFDQAAEAIEVYVLASSPGRPLRRSASTRIAVAARAGFADALGRAGGVVLGSYRRGSSAGHDRGTQVFIARQG